MPNIGDGGGVNLQGLGVGFGCPSPAQYAWAKPFYKEPLLDAVPGFLDAARKATGAPPEKRREAMLAAYAPQMDVLGKIWPNLFVAEVSGLAMLRNRVAPEPVDWVEVIFDYGKFSGRTHGHPAKLQTIPSLNGQIVSMEYGYGAFGKPEGGGFHTRSYAHNVVVADGRDQRSAAGPIQIGDLREAAGEADVQWIDADSSRIYDGIYLRRTLFTTDFGIVDLHLCRSDREHTYDWMFHSFGVAKPAFQTAPVQLEQRGPLAFAKEPRGAVLDASCQITWENHPLTKPPRKASSALLGEATYVRVWALPEKETRAVLFAAPILPEVVQEGEIDYLMLRRKATATVFATIQEPWREGVGPRVKAVRALPVRAERSDAAPTAAYALEVTTSSGERRVFFVNYSGGNKAIGRVETDANIAVWSLDARGQVAHPRHSRGAPFRVK
jgi:hypothetical protein